MLILLLRAVVLIANNSAVSTPARVRQRVASRASRSESYTLVLTTQLPAILIG